MARKAVRKASKTEETGVKRKPGRQPMTAEEKEAGDPDAGQPLADGGQGELPAELVQVGDGVGHAVEHHNSQAEGHIDQRQLPAPGGGGALHVTSWAS